MRKRKTLWYVPDWGSFFRNGKRVDAIAGGGYRTVHYKGKTVSAHRLAFRFISGEFPDNDVDHKDRNRCNNIWSNLRESTRKCNLENTERNNPFIGVTKDLSRDKWMAYTPKVKGVRSTIGRFNTNIAACMARHNWEIQNA